jgi:hypothetical protein
MGGNAPLKTSDECLYSWEQEVCQGFNESLGRSLHLSTVGFATLKAAIPLYGRFQENFLKFLTKLSFFLLYHLGSFFDLPHR